MGTEVRLQHAGHGPTKLEGFEPVAKRDQASHGHDASLDPGNRSGEGGGGFPESKPVQMYASGRLAPTGPV